MRKEIIFFLALASFSAFMLLMPFASADCINISLSKQSYLAGELFQAEVSGDLKAPISFNDIFFYKGGEEYSPAFNLEQAAANRWIVYMTLPKNYGQNSIKVKALCKNEILVEESKQVDFPVQRPLQEAYYLFESQVSDQRSSLTSGDLASLLPPLLYNSALYEEVMDDLLLRVSADGCWPKNFCDVKATSIAASSLGNTTSAQKAKAWLSDAENSVKEGLWELVLTSEYAQFCNFSINGQNQTMSVPSGSKSATLILPDDPEVKVEVYCPLTSAKISHTFMGSVHMMPLSEEGGILSITLNNQKCWGKEYKSSCDPAATAYALLALNDGRDIQKELAWLKENAASTIERSVYYSFTKDSNFESWLINNEASEGYWSSVSIASSTVPDIGSTVYAINSLSDIRSAAGRSWLREKFDTEGRFGNITDNAYALRIFSYNQIEPVVSSKGFMKVSSGKNFTMKFSNNGMLAVNLTASVSGSQFKARINPFSSKDLVMIAPPASAITSDYIDVSYMTDFGAQGSYRIPLMIFPSSIKENEFGQAIANASTSGTSILGGAVQFSQSEVRTSLPKSSNVSFSVDITNFSPDPKNVSMSISGLYDILLGIEPPNFELQPGQQKTVSVYLDSVNAIGDYNGTLSAETSDAISSLPVHLTFEDTSKKPCAQLNGTICKSGESCSGNEAQASDGKCCLAACAAAAVPKTPTNWKKFAGWAMLILAVIAAGAFFYLRIKKKPQSALKTAIERAGNPRDVLAPSS